MELKALIAESTAYDFKVLLEEKKPKSWLKSVSAFANGLGGSLFFGIDNEGTIYASLTPRMSETMAETCRRGNSQSVNGKYSISLESLRQSPASKCRRLCR